MTFLELVVIGIGGFMGAIIRYFTSVYMNRSARIPSGTLIVNLVGSFLIGAIFGWELSRLWTFFLASGLAGALTTFSTLNKELIELWRSGRREKTIGYGFWTFGGGISLAFLGYLIGTNLS